MVEDVTIELKMNILDLVILYQLSRRENITVEEWIRKTIIEKLQQLQQQQVQTSSPSTPSPSPSPSTAGGGDNR
jgi:Zn-dependent peptidase ImmA (M78 family)